MSLPLVVLGISIIVGYAYNRYEYEQSLPDNCTVDNVRHRLHELDIIAALPIPSTRNGNPTSVLIQNNLRSMLPIRGCNKRANDALEMTEYSLGNLDFVNYSVWREILQNELTKMENQQMYSKEESER
jgi:hypothetical protein